MAPKKSKEKKPKEDPAAVSEPEPTTADDDDMEEEEMKGSKQEQRDGADMQKVTDFVEQKELDSKKASKAAMDFAAAETVDREAERERARMLAAVSIDQVGSSGR